MKSWESESDSDLILRSHNQLIYVNHFNTIASDTSCVNIWLSPSHSCWNHTANILPPMTRLVTACFSCSYSNSSLSKVSRSWPWFVSAELARHVQLARFSFCWTLFFKTIAKITLSLSLLCQTHAASSKIAHSSSYAAANTHSPDSGKLKSWGSSACPHRRTMLGSCYLFHKGPTADPKTKLETDTTLNNIFENKDNREWSIFNSHVFNSL